MQDHVVHFYHLHALDWVDIVSALSADPAKTVGAGRIDLRLAAVEPEVLRRRARSHQERSSTAASSDRSPTPTGDIPPTGCRAEANLMAVAHYLEALDWQREFIKMHAVLGGKNPHLQSFLVGGMATPVDPDSQAALNTRHHRAAEDVHRPRRATSCARVYIPDLLAIASLLQGLGGPRPRRRQLPGATASIRRTTRRSRRCSCPQGIIRGRDLSKVEPFDQTKVTEYITHSWYDYQQGDDARAPSVAGRNVAQLHRARTRRTSGSTPTRSTRG